MADDISPLAQRLAEAYDVDLAQLRGKLEGKITARSVLDYLNASENSAPSQSKPSTFSGTAETPTVIKPQAQPQAQPATLPEATPTDEAAPKRDAEQQEPKQQKSKSKESKQRKSQPKDSVQTAPKAPDKQKSSAEAVADTVALAKARAQLQVTAKVHQQALMQVGELREKNSVLETEVTLLREAEAHARSQLEAFQKYDEPLEAEVEATRRRSIFAWLRRLFS